MDFSYQEKSAWGLLLGLVVVSLVYFPAAFAAADVGGEITKLVQLIVGGVIALVVIEVIYHVAIAAGSPQDADRSDERDELINLKAERNSGFVLGFGLFWLVGFIVAQSALQAYPVPEPLAIAVYILLIIAVSEIAKLANQIWYYRTGA